MEREFRLIRCAAIALTSVAVIAACHPRFSRDAARELEGRVVLLRPSRGGLQPVSVSRQPLTDIELPTRKAVAFSPDFAAYVDASVREGVFKLTLVRGDSSQLLVSEPFDATRPAQPFRVGWIDPDGTRLAILLGDRLMIFRSGRTQLERSGVTDDVLSFAVSSGSLYALKHDDRRAIEDLRNDRRIEVGGELHELFPSPNANEVIGTTENHRVIVVISTDTGKSRTVALRNIDGELRDVIPVGPDRVLVETWDGEERVDGTELSTFSLCSLDGTCSFAFKDDDHVKVHRLPATYVNSHRSSARPFSKAGTSATTAEGERLARTELMAKALEVWPLDALEQALGADADRILPPALRLVDLHVRIPRVYAAMLEHFATAKRISVSAIVTRTLGRNGERAQPRTVSPHRRLRRRAEGGRSRRTRAARERQRAARDGGYRTHPT